MESDSILPPPCDGTYVTQSVVKESTILRHLSGVLLNDPTVGLNYDKPTDTLVAHLNVTPWDVQQCPGLNNVTDVWAVFDIGEIQ